MWRGEFMKKKLLWGIYAALPLVMVNLAFAKPIKNEQIDTIQKIKTSREIVVAVREDEFPFSYLDEKGNARGYTVELCESLIKTIRKELEIPRLKVIYFPVEEKEVPLLFKKKVLDIDCGNAHVLPNNKSLDYTKGFIGVESRMLTSQTSTARTLADFNNQVIAVRGGGSVEKILNDYLKAGTYFYRLKKVSTQEEGIQSLVTGNAKTYIDDDVLLLSILATNPSLNNNYKISGFPITFKEYGFAVAPGDVTFKDFLNKKLKEKLDAGEIHTLYEKWFLKPIKPLNVNLDFGMSKSTKELLNKMQ